MEEGEYRDIYHQVNKCRCTFEKSILSRKTMCHHAHRFNLADREGISCHNEPSHVLCKQLLDLMRQKAVFALKLTRIDGPLPHGKEVKVQTGGLLGLSGILSQPGTNFGVDDIIVLIEQAKEQFGDLARLPYDELAREIVQYEGRQRRRRSSKK